MRTIRAKCPHNGERVPLQALDSDSSNIGSLTMRGLFHAGAGFNAGSCCPSGWGRVAGAGAGLRRAGAWDMAPARLVRSALPDRHRELWVSPGTCQERLRRRKRPGKARLLTGPVRPWAGAGIRQGNEMMKCNVVVPRVGGRRPGAGGCLAGVSGALRAPRGAAGSRGCGGRPVRAFPCRTGSVKVGCP